MRKVFFTGLALLAAVVLQAALIQLVPGQARVFDPFLLVVVYRALTRGETHGMLAGAVSGWVQDVLFGGPVLGISALTKIVIGFAAGLAGARFLLAGPGARTLVLLAATFGDALLFQWLASVFDVRTLELSPLGLLWRASVNASLGVVLFELIDRRIRRETLA
jgi:rod shape-determining protein MreD